MAKAKATKKTVRNGKRAAKNSAARNKAQKAVPNTVPGYPSIQLVADKPADTVAGVISANNGHDDLVVCNDGSAHIASKHIKAGFAAKRGMSWNDVNRKYLAHTRKEADAQPREARLARGVEGKMTEHSRKAVADANSKRRAGSKAEQKVAAKASKDAEKATRKSERAAKAAPKADDNRKLKLLDKKFSFGGEGTARRACWDALLATAKAKGTVADYIAAGGKAKYLPRWVSAGAIAYA